MQRQAKRQGTLLNNILWFAGSLALAFLVWLVAVVQSDPVEQRTLSERVPIRLTPNAALVITNLSDLPTTASMVVRGPGSVVSALSADDVDLTVDLSDYAPGDYTVPIKAELSPDKHASIVGTTPRQLNIRLEARLTELKPVRAQITSLPAAIYAVSAPQIDLPQVEVTGPESRVSRVEEVLAKVSLEDQRTAYDENVTLVPVDASGATVNGVTLAQTSARVVIDIQQRNDVAEVRVQPNIVGELPDGYVLTPDFGYSPQTVVVRGAQQVLDALPGTFFTEPIDLSNRTTSFEVTVPVELPDSRLLVVTGGSVTVHVGVAAQQVTRQYDHVPLTLIGEDPALHYQLNPLEVTVLVTGPQPLLDSLDQGDLDALVDVSGLADGDSTQISPVASVGQSNDNISASVLPAQIDVTVHATVTPEVTDEAN